VQPVAISNEPLQLRPLRASDADAVYRACQDPLIGQWTTQVPIPYTRKDAEEFVSVITPAGWADDTSYAWAISDPLSEALLGVISLDGVKDGRAEVGYWVSVAERGRGVATMALAEVCRFGLDILGLDVLHWQAIAGNEASRRVAQRLGFRISGPVTGLIHQRGRWRDGWVGSLTAGDRRMPEPAVLADGVVTLRAWRGGDRAALQELVDDEVIRWNGVPGRTPDQLGQWLDVSRRPERPPAARFAITDDMSRLLGNVRLTPEARTGAISVGWWLGPAARSHGYAERALRLALAWAAEHDAPRFIAGIHAGNEAAIRLAERLGMQREGLARAYWPPDQPGDPRRDTWFYSLVPGDEGWPVVDRRPLRAR
jgi:RimJ/RimL family protein N-acetyltransferase